jgi:UDP-N-acetylglucosamine transferase subunit ALG13
LIFLTVGNWHRGFDRLVKAVDELRDGEVITENVVAQIGAGQYKPTRLQTLEFCSPTEFGEIMGQARLVITHAGVGTVAQAVMRGKPVVVVPRKAELGEIGDSHQWTTAKLLEEEGKILVAYDVSELPERLEQAEHFVPVQEEGGQRIVSLVESFVAGVANAKLRR